MEKIGIEKLDEILKGGVPEKSVILIEGTPGIGKDVLAYQFIFTGVKEGEACAIVFVGRTIDEIERDFANYGMKIDRSLITWINASEDQTKGENILNCNISELFTISAAIKKFLEKNKKKKIRIMLDILSSAFMSNHPNEVYKFFSSLITELKKANATVLALLEEGMHDPQIVVSVEQLCDFVIDMKLYERDWDIQSMLRIKKAKSIPIPLKYFKFNVTDRGVVVFD